MSVEKCGLFFFSYKCVQNRICQEDKWQLKECTCATAVLHTALTLPSCNVGMQYYSLHFTQTAINNGAFKSLSHGSSAFGCFCSKIFSTSTIILYLPCLHFSNTKQIFCPHIPVVKTGILVSVPHQRNAVGGKYSIYKLFRRAATLHNCDSWNVFWMPENQQQS